jgi:hypothetical protein
LLEASRSIAQQWVEERNTDGPNAKKIPSGSSDELEGQLVEHSITLCEQLEAEIKTRKSSGRNSSRGSQANAKQRVQDMSKLGIKWQKLGTTKASTFHRWWADRGTDSYFKDGQKAGVHSE